MVAAAKAAAGRPDGVAPLVAADQEGGKVQRLTGDGFDRIPAASDPVPVAGRRADPPGGRLGRELDAVGVHVDLAPVADVVPARSSDDNEPIGALGRGYGSDPDAVGRHVAAFVRGMRAAEVATAVKHFPGLGRVRGNTDFSSGVVDRTTHPPGPAARAFRAGVAAGSGSGDGVTATYPRIDPDNRAVFSRT